MLGQRAAFGFALIASALSTTTLVRAQPPPAPDETETVKSHDAADAVPPAVDPRIQQQAEAIAELRRALEQQRKDIESLRASQAAAKRPEVAAQKPTALEDRLRISGFIQADAIVMDQRSQDQIDGSTGLPLNDNRFLIRRARLHADADFGIPTAAIEFDGNTINGPATRLIQAEASVRWRNPDAKEPPYLMASIGLFMIPFGFEVGQLDYNRTFLERSNVINALFPGSYDLGARLRGGYRSLRYAVALMNGSPMGDTSFALRDPTKSKDLDARIGVETEIAHGVRFSGGFSGVSGTGLHAGTPSTKDVLIWRDTNKDGLVEPTEIQVIAGSAATPSESFSRSAIGGDAHVEFDLPVVGTLTVYGELIWASNLDRGLVPADPIVLGRDLREFGWYAAVTQDITRYAQVGVRVDRYDPDLDSTTQTPLHLVPKDSTFTTVAVVGVARLPPHFRLLGEYDRNMNALARTANGAPANLASDTFIVRGEVKF